MSLTNTEKALLSILEDFGALPRRLVYELLKEPGINDNNTAFLCGQKVAEMKERSLINEQEFEDGSIYIGNAYSKNLPPSTVERLATEDAVKALWLFAADFEKPLEHFVAPVKAPGVLTWYNDGALVEVIKIPWGQEEEITKELYQDAITYIFLRDEWDEEDPQNDLIRPADYIKYACATVQLPSNNTDPAGFNMIYHF